MKADIDIDRLCVSIQRSRRDLERFRLNQVDLVRQYAGPYWSENAAREKRPLNLLGLYHQTMIRTLVPKSPRVMLSTFDRQYKPVVRAMQDWANQQLDKIDFAGTMRKVASNALFSVGIAKVSITTPADSALVGWEVPAGAPNIQNVDLDDYFYDTTARSFREAGFQGHRYRVPRSAAIRMLGKRAKDLQATEDQVNNEQGDERITYLGRSFLSTSELDEFEDMVTLWEVYLPRHGRVLTLADEYVTGAGPDQRDSGESTPLLDQPWVGPYCGPYHHLGFQWIPGNAMPKGMMPDLLDLDEATNESLRKIMRITSRIKEVGLVDAAASEDGQRIIEANDGDLIKVANLRGVQQVVFSGQHLAPVQAMSMMFKDLFSFMGGNLELLGGRGPQAKTAAQDKMLNENAGVGVADMQDATLSFASDVLESWLWFHHHDPFTVQKVGHPIRAGREIVRKVYPNQPKYTDPKNKEYQGRPLLVRDQSFEDMNIRVDPYSMQHQTPQTRLSFLIQTIQNIIAPVLPLIQQQGIALDWNMVFSKIGEFSDNPDLSEILTIIEPPQEGGPSGSPHERTLAPQTSREYTRHSTSDQNSQGSRQNMIASLMGTSLGGNQATAKNGVMK